MAYGCTRILIRNRQRPILYAPSPLVRDSDSLYHRLFSHPPMVAALVREFVPEALAAGLDFSRLQRVNPKFHFRRRSGRKREGDVIWRLPTREGREIYLHAERKIMPSEIRFPLGPA